MTKRWFAWIDELDDELYIYGEHDSFIDHDGMWVDCDYDQPMMLSYLFDCKGAIIEQPEMPTVAQVKEALGL